LIYILHWASYIFLTDKIKWKLHFFFNFNFY
jgi:hypothetical protein